MDYLTCEKLVEPPKKRSKWPFVAIGALGLAGLAMVAGSFVIRDNNKKVEEITAAALDLAENRSTCRIESLKMSAAFGRPAVNLTIDVATKTEPHSINKRHDELGVNATFRDNNEYDLNGIMVMREVPGSERNSVVLGGSDRNAPDTGSSTMTVTEPVLTKGRATYEVYRQNAVDALITGPRIADSQHTISSLISCGEFTYDNTGSTPILKK